MRLGILTGILMNHDECCLIETQVGYSRGCGFDAPVSRAEKARFSAEEAQ